MTPIKFACLLLFLNVATGAVHGQGVGSSGEIAGTISDPSGAGIPKATIIAMKARVETDAIVMFDTTDFSSHSLE